MPRQSEYTKEEDAIILATSGEHASTTNERLEAAGYSPRTPRQLTNRRQHLKRQPRIASDIAGDTPEQLMRRYKRMQVERDRALEFIRQQEEAMEDVAEALRQQMSEMFEDGPSKSV